MGFRLPPNVVTLTFENTRWAGLEVECRRYASPDASIFIADRMRKLEDGTALETLQTVAGRFGDELLISWNVELEDGTLPPPTGEGLKQLPDKALVLAICAKWTEAVSTVAAPLSIA